MSRLLCDHPNSHPYTLGEVLGDAQPAPYTWTNVAGETFTYKPGSAEQASDWSEDDGK